MKCKQKDRSFFYDCNMCPFTTNKWISWGTCCRVFSTFSIDMYFYSILRWYFFLVIYWSKKQIPWRYLWLNLTQRAFAILYFTSSSLYQSYINNFPTKVFLVSLTTFKLIIMNAFIDQLEIKWVNSLYDSRAHDPKNNFLHEKPYLSLFSEKN